MLFAHTFASENEIPEIKKEILLEIELNGKVRFDSILNEIYHKLDIAYKIVVADVEFFGDQNFGNIKLLLNVSNKQFQDLQTFLAEKKLMNTSVEKRKTV